MICGNLLRVAQKMHGPPNRLLQRTRGNQAAAVQKMRGRPPPIGQAAVAAAEAAGAPTRGPVEGAPTQGTVENEEEARPVRGGGGHRPKDRRGGRAPTRGPARCGWV